jgi:ATP-binding cassette subfamily F protein uup
MKAMNLLTMDNVSKTYGVKTILQEISFGIDEGEKIGLVGINGSGKSTFLKLIAGREEPDRGQMVRNSNLRMEYLPQNPPYDPEATVLDTALSGDAPAMQVWRRYREALESEAAGAGMAQQVARLSQQMEALDAWNLESEARGILTRLGITQFDIPMSRLSGGQRKRVGLAAALMNPADLLILDEPTNHLDNQAIDWLENYLQRFAGALLMVTHDRYFLERVTNRIIEIDGANLYSYPGNYSLYLERKLERESQEEAAASKKQALLRKELAWIRRGARARSTKQKARIQRFEQLKDEPSRTAAPPLQISSAASRLGKKTIVLKEVSHSFGPQTIIADYSCTIARDERLGIVGPNGIGKSTLLHIMSGEITPATGSVEIGSTVKIGYFPQESSHLPDDMRVIDYIREAGEYLQTGQKLLSASQMLETFLFTSAAQWTTLSKLSGGEKRRLHLLRILMGAPNVLLLDEPGNDLDIETLTILEDYLDDFPGAVIAVSHDRYFLDRITRRILAFEGPGRISEYTGNYSDYLEHSIKADKTDESPATESKKKNDRKGEKERPLKFTYNEQREFQEIDDKIADTEQELKDINAQIDQAATDYLLLEKLMPSRQEIEQRLEYLLERWTYLNELAEQIEKHKK